MRNTTDVPNITVEWLTQPLSVRIMYYIFDFCPTTRKLLCTEFLKEWRKKGRKRRREERRKERWRKERLLQPKLLSDLVHPYNSHLVLKIKLFSNIDSYREEEICLLSESNAWNTHYPECGMSTPKENKTNSRNTWGQYVTLQDNWMSHFICRG